MSESENVFEEQTEIALITFHRKLHTYGYFAGGPEYWYEESKIPKTTKKIRDIFYWIVDKLIFIYIVLLIIAPFTQKNLTAKQSSDCIIFSFSNPMMNTFVLIMIRNSGKFKKLIVQLIELFKKIYDEDVERQMLKQSRFAFGACTSLFALTLLSYGIDGLVLATTTENGTFTTVITAWPDTTDQSPVASYGRIIINIVWTFLVLRASSLYVYVLTVSVCISHQFKSLCGYFYKLNDIFYTDLTQNQKEIEYEKQFKLGIQLHSDLLSCVELFHSISSLTYSGQILINITVLTLLMVQLVNEERTVSAIVSAVSTIIALLFNTGLFMLKAGDITEESYKLSTAIYSSGWQNCVNFSKMKRLVVIALSQSQKPIVLKCLGIVELSYSSYVTIVKSSYSIFSIIV